MIVLLLLSMWLKCRQLLVDSPSQDRASRGPRRGAPRRHRRGASLFAAISAVLAIGVLIVGATPGAASASVGSDRNQIALLEKRIAVTGAEVQAIVSHYDAVQGHVDALDVSIAADRVRLRADRRAEHRATVLLRGVAIRPM